MASVVGDPFPVQAALPHSAYPQQPGVEGRDPSVFEEHVQPLVGGGVVHGVAGGTGNKRTVVHSVPPFALGDVLGGEPGIKTFSPSHVFGVKMTGFDEFVFDHAVGIMGLDGKGACRESLSPLAVFGFPPIHHDLVVDACLDMPSGHPDA